MRARGRTTSARGMNSLERAYAENLEMRRLAGEIHSWRFEPIRFRLADGAWYKPDFLVVGKAGFVHLHEVKGHWREAAKVRIKVAADLNPEFKFTAIQKIGSVWTYEDFGPKDV